LFTAGVGAAIYALWLVPLIVGYFRLGGFRSLAATPVDLPVWATVFSWGVTTPFAIYGAFRLVARTHPKTTRVIIALLIATSTLLLVSALVELLPGQGFDTLGGATAIGRSCRSRLCSSGRWVLPTFWLD